MGLGAVLSAVLLSGHCSLAAPDFILLDDDTIRIRDVAELTCLQPEQQSAFGDMVLGKLPDGFSEIRIPRSAIANKIKQRVPGLDLAPGEKDAAIRIRRQQSNQRTRADVSPCFATRRAIHAKAAVAADALSPVTCRGTNQNAAVYYDRTDGVVRAAAELQEGAYLGRMLVPQQALVDVGAEILLVTTIGPVRIERQVWAMQPASGGSEIFVRDSGGMVFKARTKRSSSGADRK